MKKLGTYRNRLGEVFTVTLADAPTPESADHWAYFFAVEDAQKRRLSFSALVKKSVAAEERLADAFVTGDPFDYLKSLLDSTKDGQTPIDWPMTGDWFVVPGIPHGTKDQTRRA